jgi:hypothetical protein
VQQPLAAVFAPINEAVDTTSRPPDHRRIVGLRRIDLASTRTRVIDPFDYEGQHSGNSADSAKTKAAFSSAGTCRARSWKQYSLID